MASAIGNDNNIDTCTPHGCHYSTTIRSKMIRRIVTCSVQNGSKVVKEFPLRCLTLDTTAGPIRSILNNHHRSFLTSTKRTTTTIQLPSTPRQLHKLWFSTTIDTLEVDDDNENDLNDDDDDDDVDDETSPPIGPSETAKFAVVFHGAAYEKAMDGLHGQQLATAQLEGEGKDEPDFDPFLEEELEEARLLYEEEKMKQQQKEESSDKASTGTTSTNKANETTENTQESSDEMNEENVEDTVIDTTSQKYQYKLFRQKYNNDGSIKRNKSEMAILRAGAPSGGRIAVVALGGTQYKVTTDDLLIVNLLKPVQHYAVGSIRTLTDEQVLLVSSSAMTLVGMPYVKGAEVDVMVEEITRDAKVIIYKKRRRKNSQRRTGFRRDVTMLRVLDIRFPHPYDTHEHTIRPEPAPLVPISIRKIV